MTTLPVRPQAEPEATVGTGVPLAPLTPAQIAGLDDPALLQQCVAGAFRLSEQLTARYFTHSDDARQSVGA